MAVSYTFVQWNRFKKRYDITIAIAMVSYLAVFFGIGLITNPEITAETLLIRSFGSLAIILLHIILVIGPLCRLNKRFLPLLYNRRHLGVSMFIAALAHGVISTIQFHTLGTVGPLRAIFTSNLDYGSLTNFPFQVLGFLALMILFVMASTSHDFFLKNLSPKVWKALHMLVYPAYILILSHVLLGSFQQEASVATLAVLGSGFIVVASLHVVAAFKNKTTDYASTATGQDWIKVCKAGDIKDKRAKIFDLKGEKIALFRDGQKISAVHNVCKHQGGPLGEGKIVDGCITCPWHGYQYLAHNGQSPPPFKEKLKTYQLKLDNGFVHINPKANAEGTAVEPIEF